jgi:hypothetical protein
VRWEPKAEMRLTLIVVARRPKSCGPDAPSLASRERSACQAYRPQETTNGHLSRGQLNPDGDEQSVSIAAGESTKQAGSLTARGTPDVTVLVVTTLVCPNSTLHTRLRTHISVRRSVRPRF